MMNVYSPSESGAIFRWQREEIHENVLEAFRDCEETIVKALRPIKSMWDRLQATHEQKRSDCFIWASYALERLIEYRQKLRRDIQEHEEKFISMSSKQESEADCEAASTLLACDEMVEDLKLTDARIADTVTLLEFVERDSDFKGELQRTLAPLISKVKRVFEEFDSRAVGYMSTAIYQSVLVYGHTIHSLSAEFDREGLNDFCHFCKSLYEAPSSLKSEAIDHRFSERKEAQYLMKVLKESYSKTRYVKPRIITEFADSFFEYMVSYNSIDLESRSSS